jgi:hypothetical protein
MQNFSDLFDRIFYMFRTSPLSTSAVSEINYFTLFEHINWTLNELQWIWHWLQQAPKTYHQTTSCHKRVLNITNKLNFQSIQRWFSPNFKVNHRTPNSKTGVTASLLSVIIDWHISIWCNGKTSCCYWYTEGVTLVGAQGRAHRKAHVRETHWIY